MNGMSSLEKVNENSPEFKKLTEAVEEFKNIIKGNEGDKNVIQLLKYAEMAGLM